MTGNSTKIKVTFHDLQGHNSIPADGLADEECTEAVQEVGAVGAG
jgi:hypothetical protein